MELEFVPLLRAQRDIYRLPRGRERFEAYLHTMVDSRTGDLAFPLVDMNPMGKDHLPPLLDRLLELDAETVGAAATAAAQPATADVAGAFRVGLVVSDDARGGWTDRHCNELGHRFDGGALYRRGWIVGLLWTSETPSRTGVRREVLTSIHRLAHIRRRGPATTIAAMLKQEGEAMAAAGCREPALDPDDLAYTREIIEPYLAAADRPTVVACLYGDEAARKLGYRPLGFSPRAGLALALDAARRQRAARSRCLTGELAEPPGDRLEDLRDDDDAGPRR